jgi:hypothetical protein
VGEAPEREVRRCACPCREPLPASAHGRQRYVDPNHKNRAYRARVKARMKAAGLPASLSLKAADAARTPRNRLGDAEKQRQAPQRRRRPDQRVQLRAAVDAVADYLVERDHPSRWVARETARRILDPALPPRLRKAPDAK